MPLLEGFWIKNYRILRQVAVGSCYLQFVYVDEETSSGQYELSPLTLLIGKNGTGKSTVFDAFAFIGDCMRIGVEDACLKRGGYDAIYSQGSKGPISFGFNFRLTPGSHVLSYVLNVDLGANDRPFVDTELLAYRAEDLESFTMPILFFQNGEKIVRHVLVAGKIGEDMSRVERTDMRHLGIASLGDHKEYPVVGAIKKFFEGVYLAKAPAENQNAFNASPLPPHQPGQRGEGLMPLIRYMQQEYADDFPKILENLAQKLPGIESLLVEKGRTGRPVLAVKQKDMPGAISAAGMSEGFLKYLLYLMLLEEPTPPSLIGIDEPENGLDIRQLRSLSKELHKSIPVLGESQVLLTTQHQNFADWLPPHDVWVFEKMGDGFTHVQRGCDYPTLLKLIKSGEPFGDFWYSDYLDQSWREHMS